MKPNDKKNLTRAILCSLLLLAAFSITATPQVVANSVLECPILSAATTNATNCKAGPGAIVGYELYNTTTTIYYLRLYNTVAAPNCASATGFIRSIPIIPAAAAGSSGGQIRNYTFPVGYGTGISWCITAGSGNTDNTAAAVGIFGAIQYK